MEKNSGVSLYHPFCVFKFLEFYSYNLQTMAHMVSCVEKSKEGVSYMEITRRGFFKATALAFAGSMAYELSGQSKAFAIDTQKTWKLENTEEVTTICCNRMRSSSRSWSPLRCSQASKSSGCR